MISIQPTETRFVNIRHEGWDLDWSIQFPEAIVSAEGMSMSWEPIHPEWEQDESGAWIYAWRTTEEYLEGLQHVDAAGFVMGLALHARIWVDEDEVRTELTITNEAGAPFHEVRSEGGCFQARSDAFCDHDEVARSHVAVAGEMVSMPTLHRTEPIRALYRSAEDLDDSHNWEWFWGRSDSRIDAPTILGAVSKDGTRAVAIAYEQSVRGMQNADDHHCLHSCPRFGDIESGKSVTRRGYIRFGDDIDALATDLRERIGEA